MISRRHDAIDAGPQTEFDDVVYRLVDGGDVGMNGGHVTDDPAAVLALFHMRDREL